ncbi:hypothetical protein [Paenibacillus tepidiphilus]|uniref:hypothetical protein n=1 Tax=Paenibacillus tepidiphilus TaxID=2608683 RepID=UPI00123A39E3|nr:hypothetical protein [Paenibacillus tepidiphilus]
MPPTNFRTEKLEKELATLFSKRLDIFEDLKFFALNGEEKDVKFCYGKGDAYRRCICDLLIAFSLTGTELYKQNNKRFELEYLMKQEETLKELNESPTIPVSSSPLEREENPFLKYKIIEQHNGTPIVQYQNEEGYRVDFGTRRSIEVPSVEAAKELIDYYSKDNSK